MNAEHQGYSAAEAAAAGWLAGVAAVVLGMVDGIGPGVALLALVVGLMMGVVVWMRLPWGRFPGDGFPGQGERSRGPASFLEWAVIGAFAFACWRAFFWLVYPVGDAVRVLSPNNLGDLSLHVHMIRYLASGVTFWPESSIFSGTMLRYPAGMNVFNAVLGVAGIDTFRGLVGVGVVSCAVLGVVLWRWGGAFAMAAFLFAGGLAGFAFFRGFELADYQADLAWKNLFLAAWVPQRGLLFALPAGLLVLDAWRALARGQTHPLPPWVQTFLYALMPLFNVHAFLYLSLQLLALFLLCRASRKRCLAIVAAALVPAACGVWLVTDGFSAGSGIAFQPGWMQGGDGPWFWIWNFGLMLPLGAGLVVFVWRSADSAARPFVWTAAGVFLLCCFVRFSAWDWDNVKLMLWSWLVIAPFLWTEMLRPLAVPARAAVCFVLFFSGAVSLVGGLDGRHGYDLTRRSKLAEVEAGVSGLPADFRFAAAPDYNHPLLLLGRKVVTGYHGHLWSHGYDYTDHARDLERLYSGPDAGDAAIARRLGADAIFVGEREAAAFPGLNPTALRAAGQTIDGEGFFIVLPVLLGSAPGTAGPDGDAVD